MAEMGEDVKREWMKKGEFGLAKSEFLVNFREWSFFVIEVGC